MTELTTAPDGAPLADGDILLVRKAGSPGVTKVLAEDAKDYFGAGGGASYPDFVGNAGKALIVNEDEDGVEWGDAPGGGGGGGGYLKGLVRASRATDFAISAATWTTVPWDSVEQNTLAGLDETTGVYTVPVGVTLLRAGVTIAHNNGVGNPLATFRNITTGQEVMLRLAAAQFESGFSATTPWIAVTPGDEWDVRVNTSGANEVVGPGSFGGPSFMSIEEVGHASDLIMASGGGSGLYRFGSFFTTEPGADEVLLLHVATDDFELPNDLVGTVFNVGTNPSGDVDLDLQLNGASVATVTIASTGTVTLVTAAGAVAVAEGDVLALIAPADSLGAANVAFTFRGSGTASGGAAAFSGARVHLDADYARASGELSILSPTSVVEYDVGSWWNTTEQGFVVPGGVNYVVFEAQRATTSNSGLRLYHNATLKALVGDTTQLFIYGSTGPIPVVEGDVLYPNCYSSGGYTLDADEPSFTWAAVRAVG